jgi:hypothetical protein
LAKLRYPHRYKLEKGTVDPEILLGIMCKALSKTILLGWSNVVDAEGNDVPFSEEAASRALKNSLFREFVINTAAESENYRAEFIDNSIK